MIWHSRTPVHVRKTRAIHEFYEACLSGVKGNMKQALIFSRPLVDEVHLRLRSRVDHALGKQQFGRQRVQVPEHTKRIFQVVQKTEAEDQVELPKIKQCRRLRIESAKFDFRVAAACLLNVLAATIDCSYLESNRAQKGGKMS
jgi:hypothetical protein